MLIINGAKLKLALNNHRNVTAKDTIHPWETVRLTYK